MIYNERCTIVANKDGSIKTVFVDQLGIDVESNREFNAGQKTIGDAELDQFLGSVFSTTVAERDALATDKTKLTTDLASMTAQYDASVVDKARLISNNTTAITTLNTTHTKVTTDAKIASDKVLAEMQANHAQIVLAKDADLAATKSELAGITIIRNELQGKIRTLNELVVAKDTEITRLKAAFNPPIPTTVIGETKTVSITVDATAWAGILSSIFDPNVDVPAEQQATDFILHQYAAKFTAWAERENFKPIEAQMEATKKQIKEATQARVIEVLSSTKVTIE